VLTFVYILKTGENKNINHCIYVLLFLNPRQKFKVNFCMCKIMCRLFKECPHPDDKQRLKLSHDLGLKPRQVKFWFQNRRTQMKVHMDQE
jgi:hypothetical protein